jgi:indole-3-glycerol phosphate synthase
MSLSSDFLQQMASGSRERVLAARRECSEAAMLERALTSALPAPLAKSPAGFDVIAELKLRSPAAGQIRFADENIGARVTTYAQAGAAAISVLTEPSRFDGSMAHLQTAARSLEPLGVPAMRKDFIVDPYQVIEARAAGAGGVLVIMRMLTRAEIETLMECARKLQLFVLLEAFDERDIEAMHEVVAAWGSRSAKANPDDPPLLAGLNCRDLTTLQVVPARLEALAHLLPSDAFRVAESGVVSADDARRVAGAGYDYALVGSALMQARDPRAMVAGMLRAGRAEARRDA